MGVRGFGVGACALALVVSSVSVAQAEERTFEAGSLIIPMDLAYQDSGLLQSYGLLFQLLRHRVPVYWVIDQDKTWHAADCDAAGDECAWDCAVEGSGIKCPYPTASPDFFVGAEVLWDSEGLLTAGTPISNHGYRGGPFVIDAADRTAALEVIDAWNDQSQWTANPWAARTVFQVVSVHSASASLTGWVRKEMVAAPTIAVFSDGHEDVATGYLRAAGIPQSSGAEFPADKCGDDDCGPGTANPDMLTVPSIMGDMGTCDAPNLDHENGALFTPDGVPAYCQIMSMHWDVGNRETVECDGGDCPDTEAECAGERFTYHGHEVVAEVRQFLQYPTHFFAECQAVNAYENTVPNPAWPYLDDDGREGHFLTTTGMPPACPCTDGDFECVTGGCAGVDCCLPKNAKERGAGFLIADQPDSNSIQILHPEVPYNQLDGSFATTGGSEPAYNLSTYLGTMYKNNREVTFITGPTGPGVEDVWMTGFVDGECDLVGGDDVMPPSGMCNGGKVSYLGGHRYSTDVPISSNAGSQGARLFLNALFEADCVTSVGQPAVSLSLEGPAVVPAQNLPVEADYVARYLNQGRGIALGAVLTELVPAEVTMVAREAGAVDVAGGVEWTIGTVSAAPVQAGDPADQGGRSSTLSFPAYGDYDIELRMRYRVGLTDLEAAPRIMTVRVVADSDGDGVPDTMDPAPNDPNICGDADNDGCDDCDSGCTPGPGGDGDEAGGCCRTSSDGGQAAGWLLLAGLLALVRRRRAL